ncbi:amino acid ABC transporter permease [Embleya scabrispora]|uniref:amino acid ABC transporter permease n=1 Tax=Embleya scabrispora TaxID=159449 RepID=UPI00036D15CA|nr:amino acid ABC transporter permease [Embleya scabrispora]MYS84610.1 ABC transporter permease subunit [Streptomyces sp. SID5474]
MRTDHSADDPKSAAPDEPPESASPTESAPEGTRHPSATTDGLGDPDLTIRAIPQRHPFRRLAAVVIAVLIAAGLWSAITNPRYEWDVVAEWLTAETIVKGLLKTLELTAMAMAIGTLLGIVLAVMSGSRNRLVSGSATAYIWFFRGTPLLVQLIFWFNISALYPQISLGVPFGGPVFASFDANELITPMTAGLLGLALNEAAYMAEIVRAGIISVPPGQLQAATALGMTNLQTTRKIVLPQAMRVIVPPTGNQTISLLKTSSLVSVLAIPELLYSSQIVYARTFQTIPLLITASIWYLLVTSILTVLQGFLERRFSPDADRPDRRRTRLRLRKALT